MGLDWLDTKKYISPYEGFVENKDEPLILFGASGCGIRVSEELKKLNANVIYFCDNDINKTGKMVNNIKVISLDELSKLGSDIKIGITSYWAIDIKEQLLGLGYKNAHIISDMLSCAGWFDKDIILESTDAINRALNILEDEQSAVIFKQLINYRFSMNMCYVQAAIDIRGNKNLYFDKELIHLSNDEIFVDGGSFDGDTTMEFIKRVQGEFLKIYLFEPDPSNYVKVLNKVKDHKDYHRFELYNTALGSKAQVLKFSNSGDMGSHISANGDIEVKVDSLDEIIDKATFIKLDIEGSEKEALLGAQRIIKSYKPKLAICLYHKPSDMWELPLLIKELNPNYKIYIRHYLPNGFETICYAV